MADFCLDFSGLDYTVAHFGTMVFKPRLSLNFCHVDDFDDDLTSKGEKLSGEKP